MIKQVKKLLVWFMVMLLVSSMVPQYANAEDSIGGDIGENPIFQLTKDFEIEDYGVLKEGAIFYGNNLSDGSGLNINVQEDEVFIPAENYTIISELPTPPEYMIPVNGNIVSSENPIQVYEDPEFSIVIAELNGGQNYNVESITDVAAEVVIGNRIGYIKIDQVSIVEDSPAGEESLDPDSQPDSNDEQLTEEDNNTVPEENESEEISDDTEGNTIIENETENQEVSEEQTDLEDKEVTEVEEEKSNDSLMLQSSNNTRTLLKAAPVYSRYFSVTDDRVPVYEKTSKGLVTIGYLFNGQDFEILRVYTSWLQVQFGEVIAYVPKEGTKPEDRPLHESAGNYKAIQSFKANQEVIIYDSTSDSKLPLASIAAGETYPLVGEMTDYYKVIVSNREGYVKKSDANLPFTSSMDYFEVIESDAPVYEKVNGNLIEVGRLTKGQVFPRTRDYTSWHQVKLGNTVGYVSKENTRPPLKINLKNEFNGSSTNRTITMKWDSVLYDNTSGKLVKFAVLKSGKTFPIIKEYTSWYSINIGGRIGYVNKNNANFNFTSSDQYFEVVKDNVPIYDNSTGSLVKVGELVKGQIYPRTRDYTSWHQIKFGSINGFVAKDQTGPASGPDYKNGTSESSSSDLQYAYMMKNATVYDNKTSSTLTPFMSIEQGVSFPIEKVYTSWVEVNVAGRIGFIKKEDVNLGPLKVKKYSSYNLSLEEALDKQMAASAKPQVWDYVTAYVHKDYIKLNPDNANEGIVTATSLNVREKPNTLSDTFIYGRLTQDSKIKITGETGDWYKFTYGPWINAKRDQVQEYLNPQNFTDEYSMFQFLSLSRSTGVSAQELNNLLKGKGVLEGKGQAFIDAALMYGINEIYLVSHALLETGNGTSQLATGVQVKDKDGKTVTVYNMFGYGAYDSCPLTCGSQAALDQGWFTVDQAIIGGAYLIASDWILAGKDTLYKMKWNPLNPGTSQYATDIRWAYNQVNRMSQLYSTLKVYTLYYDIPVYN
ncbi:N-acetylglucosaminidase [Cytobacillus firmus]|uniref:glucosaminidase domain-containing protein n=1 Tax=Cytobacillus firmus TaxID=1399 RepID=UPI00384EF28B